MSDFVWVFLGGWGLHNPASLQIIQGVAIEYGLVSSGLLMGRWAEIYSSDAWSSYPDYSKSLKSK